MRGVSWLSPEAFEVMRLARNGSGPGETDEVLADAILAAAAGDEGALVDALNALPVVAHPGYHLDRGRRVLVGLVSKKDIQPPKAEARERYRAEQELEEMPRRDALAVLCRREPALAVAVTELLSESARRRKGGGDMRFRTRCNRRLRSIVGPEGASSDALVASEVAVFVTAQAFKELMGWDTSPAADA